MVRISGFIEVLDPYVPIIVDVSQIGINGNFATGFATRLLQGAAGEIIPIDVTLPFISGSSNEYTIFINPLSLMSATVTFSLTFEVV